MEIDELLEDDFDEASDEADNEYQYLNDPSSAQPSSGPPSTPNSCASSPPVNTEEPISPQRNFYTSILSHGGSTLVFSSGKPYGPKRGPGRPRKEFAPGVRHTKDIRGIIRKCRGGIMKGTKKKFLGKDERNALLTLSQDNGCLQSTSKSPSDFTGNNLEISGSEMLEKTNQSSEEVPYFLERWPGKVCSLCNLGERSQLGQGEMLRLEINESENQQYNSASPSNDEKERYASDVFNSNSAFPQFSNRRQKGLNKCKNPVNTSEYIDELEKIGYSEPIELSNVQDSNYYYVHRQCATWSFGILTEPTAALDKITSVISQSLRRKCAYCNHYGASITCKMSCPKVFHYPCVTASGGFQIIQNYASFCKEHLGQVPLVCTDDVNCRSCSMLGDVSNLVMCSICGDHYHGTCIGLAQLPGVRAGWQCVSCRKCQICRVPDLSEGRSLPCEQCQKVYHAHCLRPVMSSIPKYGWKCRRCRVCSDCGSRTPGAGASSRWHAHYTVCDSCYQQRNKGFSCPICHRAYRAAAYREMVKCSCCNKFVHNTCDGEAELSNYHAKKESNPDYEYVCPPCKIRIQNGRHNQQLIRRNSHIDEDSIGQSQESLCTDEGDTELFDKAADFGLGKGKPFSASKIAKKRMGFSFGQLGRAKGKVGFQKRPRLAELGRKRGPKTKMRGIFGVPGLGLQRPTNVDCFNTKNEDEPGVENRLVLCSAKDKFILTQDICVMCGAIGTDHEGCLISCTQCGQCYHPYCVNVKVTKVILKKGWRCLDCTVCEGCGQKNDEARLILCDECDISYHIYCMDPPLDIVPQGNWKCKWCAVCQKCGKNSPGKNCSWKNSHSECGPCASQTACSFCSDSYNEGELIIQCTNCDRWLHCKCDSIKNEDEAEKCDEAGYVCIMCRPKDLLPPHLMPSKKIQSVTNRLTTTTILKTPEETDEIPVLQGLDGTHFVDGVYLSEHGLNLIKSLQMEYIRKKRKQKLTHEVCLNNKDAGILAAIESVVAGSGIENAIDDPKLEPLDPKEEAEIYKDGMVWDRSDASPPEGFALCTNEQGVVVLRKKRQRNLQKLGIGGFNVRNRAIKKDGGFKDEAEENMDNITSYVNENSTSEKKRKPLRKRHKNKLTETYPVYLQEAFFGKNLLDTNKTNFESESSEDDTKSTVSDDKIIKLSPEELKMLDCMKTEAITAKSVTVNDNNVEMKVKNNSNDLQVGTPNLDDDIENNDQNPLKDILPQDLLDSDLVNSIMNDGNELTKASGSIEVPNENRSSTPRKDDLVDILNCPNFNLDSIEINSKDVEEIFQDVIDTNTKAPMINKTEVAIMSPKPSPFQSNSSEMDFSTDNSLGEVKTPVGVNNFISVAQSFATNTNLKVAEQLQNVPNQTNVAQNYIRPHDQNSSSPIAFGTNWAATTVANIRACTEQSLSQNDDILANTPTTQASQKSSERMRRDEDLGKMATISAVLYANTNHPELKQDYPNWPDRCKQIYKRWRALSSEKKAPFLQQARDNRSALKMKRAQQAEEAEKDTTDSSMDITGSVGLDNNDNNDEDSTSVLSSCSSIDNEKSLELKDYDDNTNGSNRCIIKTDEKKIEKNIVTNQLINNVHPVRCKFNFVKNASVQAVANKPISDNNKETSVKKTNLHKFYISSNLNGPAPNVTVNANGAFNTNSKAVLHTYCASRPITNHFLVMNKNPQKLSIDLSAIGIPVQKDRQVVIKNITTDPPNVEVKKVQMKNKNMQTVITSEATDESGRKSSVNPIFLDQNIRVLTPSEIMKTLPIIPGQDTTIITENSPSSVNNALDQEKITSQQKSLKQQEQERQWKQLQALRAKEQQIQQFTTQVPPNGSTPNSTLNFPSSEHNPSIEKRPVFSSIPGTPRPQFNADIVTPTVYASQIEAYQSNLLPLSSSFGDSSTKQQENKQLRDLLQRQEDSVLHSNQSRPISSNLPQIETGVNRWTQDEQTLPSPSVGFGGTTTFREPFPVSVTNRSVKVVANTNATRLSAGPVTTGTIRLNLPNKKITAELEKRQKRTKDETHSDVVAKNSVNLTDKDAPNKMKTNDNIKSEGEIPENVTAELEKLEQEDNAVMAEVEGVGDILGGLGEDDDDELLNSLTAEMGEDFNILAYADPELDALTDNVDHNLLDRLDFDEGDPDERLKKASGEIKNFAQRNEHLHMEKQTLHPRHPIEGHHEGEHNLNLKNRQEFILRKDIPAEIRHNFIANQQNFTLNRIDLNATKAQEGNFRSTTLPRYSNVVAPGTPCKIPRSNLPPPPPPYPGPPPPYPVNTSVRHNQDQPLLLEDLLEQEKREQQQLSSSIITSQMIDKKPISQANVFIKTDTRTPSITNTSWRKKANEIEENKKDIHVQLFNANLQAPPPLPPDNILTEQDRILQINYENWLNNQNAVLNNQLKYYEDEVMKLRKNRKSLNSKQRSMKKTGGELLPQDAMELAKVTAEQALIQKQLESARKLCRQHSILFQDYRTKHMAKVSMSTSNTPSPAQMTSMSPMLSPSTNSQSSMLMQTSPSPLGGHILQCTKSPLHSPSPLLSHSPSGISQSPVHQSNSNASPYNTMQSSPRISTPHSHIDENSFSPSATIPPSPSSLPGRHASPAPRITSPQHQQNRMNVNQMSAASRIVTSPVTSFGGNMQSQQQVKFNNQDRVRLQMTSQHNMHQNVSPLGSPQPIVSPTQIQSVFGTSQDMLQTQRTMHFIQQRQIIQRQHVNQNQMKPKSQTASSPIQNQGMGSAPSSPLLQYNLVPNQSILINTLSNRRNNSEQNSNDQLSGMNVSSEQMISQNRDSMQPSDLHQQNHQQQQQYSRSSSDGGGGLSNITGHYLPICESAGKYGRIRLGLFGGSPMWNISNVRQKLNIEAKSRATDSSCLQTKDNTLQTTVGDKNDDGDKTPASEVVLTSTSASSVNMGSKNTCSTKQSDSGESIQNTESSVKNSGNVLDDVVIIDSSPDEKQGIIDYDDFQDKGFVATEVSLNSAAQHISDGDDMTVIESLVTSDLGEIVTSPLESEVTEEYVLFSTDVVDYVDSDDSLKQNSLSQKSEDTQTKCNNNYEKEFDSVVKKTGTSPNEKDIGNSEHLDSIGAVCSSSHSTIISPSKIKTQAAIQKCKTPEVKNFATTEDFEAMIDGRNIKDTVKLLEDVPCSAAVTIKPTTCTTSNFITSNILTCGRNSFTTVQCNVINANTTPSTAVMVTPKKIVADMAQTTAKVSIGNTTISVPLLKSMTLSPAHLMSSEKQNKVTGNISLTKQPTILNVRGQKINAGKIVSLSSLHLKPATNVGNTKIVQATVVGNKIQLPQTVDSLGNIKHNIMQPFSYPKLSSLTVLQDLSLPNKIFEDESISPDSSIEQEDSENVDIKDYNLSKKESVTVISESKETNSTDRKPGNTNNEDISEKTIISEKSKDPPAKTEQTVDVQRLPNRVISIMPQLSPLSQPTELTTNMANVSQQLRTIMSSINSSSLQIESKSQTENSSNNMQTNSESSSFEKHQSSSEKETNSRNLCIDSDSTLKTTSSGVTTMKVFLAAPTTVQSQITSDKIRVMTNEEKQSFKKTKLVVPTSIFSTISSNLDVAIASCVGPSNSTITVSSSSNQDSQQASKKIILSSSNIKRSRSIDETVEREVPAQISGYKRYSLEVIPNKSDTQGNEDSSVTFNPAGDNLKTNEQIVNGCKTSNVVIHTSKSDESQNVLLKQLLQNSTNSSSTVTTQVIPSRKVSALRAPSLGVVSSLEAQLARPVIPPVPTSPPSLLQSNQQQHVKLQTPTDLLISEPEESTKKSAPTQIVSRETSFVSNPVAKNLKQINEKLNLEKANAAAAAAASSPQEQPKLEHQTIKVENLIECKKPETGCSSPVSSVKIEVSDNSFVSRITNIITEDSKPIKTEVRESSPINKFHSIQSLGQIQSDMLESFEQSNALKDDKVKLSENFESSVELKKKKKREYQKNRRQQMQMSSKETTHLKKRSRKLSKFDEDYDNFIDNLMVQLRQMPQLQVLEPLLSRNYGICPPYGAGDLTKIGFAKDQTTSQENLFGEYGDAKSKSYVDYYNTKPFGALEIPPEPYPASMHNGFYDQEFPPIKFESDFDQGNKFDYLFKDRDIDTPESIVTSSSPECVIWDAVLPFPGLRVINEDCNEDDEYGRMSPLVPVIAPIPVKLQSGIDLSIDKKLCDSNKENTVYSEWKNKSTQLIPPKDSNVTVTLTLSSSAAEDIMGVLRDLANILHIPPPTSYQIIERTTTPPSQKLGLYRTKGRDGKEGDPVDIQTILNGAAKFCRHCDVVILNTIIRAKACEFPLLSGNNELLNSADELYFCSKSCYKQFKWRPTNILDDTLNLVNSSTGNFNKFERNSSGSQIVENLDDEDIDLYKDIRLRDDRDFNSNVNKNLGNQNTHKKYGTQNSNVANDFISKASRYKYFSHSSFASTPKFKKPTEKEITEMLFRMNITVTPVIKVPEDTRRCIFCNQSGDGVADGPSRLLNFDVDKWVHLNCALWSDGVYETVNGALMNLEAALQASLNQTCTLCHHLGATIKCFKNRCGNVYHLSCAIKDKCVFYKNKSTHCLSHALKNEKENELTTLSVQRRVYVDRDESRQVAAVMHHSELSNLLRVGSLIFLNVGQLLPHQLQAFHNSNYIYPIGYKIIRFYWSMRKPNKRCRYICSIGDDAGRPEFRVLIKEPSEQDIELKDSTPKAVWQRILEPLSLLRKNCELVQLFPKYVTGEDLFGLTEPAVVRILESLPGIETLTDYRFKYGRNPLLELPLAINPSGAARTEPKQKQTVAWRKPHTQRSGSTNQRLPLTPTISVAGEVACPYSKQFVHSKSSQYKKMKQEWRNNVYLARSKIQGLGLYAARDLEKHTMVIEYIGEVIRTEVSELREKQFEAKNRGIYMFRLDEERVVDATLSGGLARYINHSCNPNCVTEIVEVDREYRIIIFAKRRINRGEELSYDYKFDIEDDAHKISCMCGAPNCRKWMN